MRPIGSTCYIPELNITIEYDEDNHQQYTLMKKHEGRQALVKNWDVSLLGVGDVNMTMELTLGIVIKEINYQLY